MSPGSLHFLWHTQDVIHCIFQWVLEPPLHLKLTLIMRDLLGIQQRLSMQTPQYVGLNFLVLVHPESFRVSAFFAWNLGRHVFPFGIWRRNPCYEIFLCSFLLELYPSNFSPKYSINYLITRDYLGFHVLEHHWTDWLTFTLLMMLFSHGCSWHRRRSFLISHLLLSLLTRTERPNPQVLEQGLQAVVWTKQFFFHAKGRSL